MTTVPLLRTDEKNNFRQAVIYYENGNIPESVKYFKKAAKLGNKHAQYNLGLLSEHGFIGECPLQEAAKWYSLATINGHEEAKEALKEIIRKRSSRIYCFFAGVEY